MAERKRISRPTPEYFEQLALGLVVDEETAESGYVSPDEARLRSETARQVLEDRSDTEWTATYAELRAAGWNWRVAAYIAWAASPKRDRWPKTQQELATEVLGLTSDRVIATWRRKNPAIDDAIALLQSAPLMDHRADIYAALIKSASDPDHRSHQDRKLALELLGDYVPHVKVEDDRQPVDLSNLSDAELAVLGRQLIERSADGEEAEDG